VSFSKPSLSSQVHAFNILCLCSHFFLPLILFGFFLSISIFFSSLSFVFALWLDFFGLYFSCGFCWPSQHQSANCHSCDRNVWHLTYTHHWSWWSQWGYYCSWSIPVLNRYQAGNLVYRLVLVLVSENRPDWYDLN